MRLRIRAVVSCWSNKVLPQLGQEIYSALLMRVRAACKMPKLSLLRFSRAGSHSWTREEVNAGRLMAPWPRRRRSGTTPRAREPAERAEAPLPLHLVGDPPRPVDGADEGAHAGRGVGHRPGQAAQHVGGVRADAGILVVQGGQQGGDSRRLTSAVRRVVEGAKRRSANVAHQRVVRRHA